jgi:class 3 adenylate cyclase
MYDYLKGVERIDKILNNNEGFEELKYIPSLERLTHNNGFYVSCSSIFVDIRKSSNLTDSHNRPTLAKLYRAFISEVIAVLQSSDLCKHIEIQGDCVNGIFDTRYTDGINELFSLSAQILSMINILNYKFSKKNIINISAGIGLSYGRALMVKAGLKGAGENGVVWIGDVVNTAAKLSKGENVVFLSDVFQSNLNDNKKSLCKSQYSSEIGSYYEANRVNTVMDNWLNDQKSRNNNYRTSSLPSFS